MQECTNAPIDSLNRPGFHFFAQDSLCYYIIEINLKINTLLTRHAKIFCINLYIWRICIYNYEKLALDLRLWLGYELRIIRTKI